MKKFFSKILMSIFGDGGLDKFNLAHTDADEAYKYLKQKILQKPDYFTLQTQDDFHLLMSAIDWEKNELNGIPLREWQINYYERLIKSKMFISHTWSNWFENANGYDIDIKDFSSV